MAASESALPHTQLSSSADVTPLVNIDLVENGYTTAVYIAMNAVRRKGNR